MDSKILKTIEVFEEKINSAYSHKYNIPISKVEEYVFRINIDIFEFYKLYINSSYYDGNDETTYRIITNLVDIKMQLFFIQEIELGQYNSRVVDKVGVFSKIPEDDLIFLTKLNIDQNMINKIRILWERVMNFIFLIATRNQLESKKSKKLKFKSFLSEHQEWDFMNNIMRRIEAFDNAFRTPEVHKFSRLRSMFLEGEDMKVDEYCFNLLNTFINETYVNILSVLKGEEASVISWSKTPDTNDEVLKVFNEVPEVFKEMENVRTVGNFKKAKKIEFDNVDKDPGELCEFLVNKKKINALIHHNSTYNEDGVLIQGATKIWITCEEENADFVTETVKEYLLG